ncbi:hypothetical protein [Burkholderia sp. lig30]|uniref:hypothetical protein n=1 Tax=Burkholderia sp. lig30 TaxID=1192124 RepID=UPI001F3A55B4|nr:hypothetical protein [Burkholderia sp. lig30]
MQRNTLVALAGLWLAAVSSAQGTAGAQPGSATKPVCVDVEVDGKRALSYDCLNAKLQPSVQPGSGASQPASRDRANEPSNRVGTFNLSTEKNRFGKNWGKSVNPQRPAAPVAVPPK